MIRGVVVGLVLAALAGATARRLGLSSFAPLLPEGPGAWLASRAGGLTAYLALSLEIATGLFLSTGVADRWIARARSIELHRWLSATTLALVAGHAGALLLDRVVPFDAFDLVVPFLAPWRRVAVGLGVLGAWLALAVHASFALRDRIGARAWRALHYGSFATFALATAHGVLAGTDASRVRGVYLGAATIVLVLLLARLFVARRAPALTRA